MQATEAAPDIACGGEGDVLRAAQRRQYVGLPARRLVAELYPKETREESLGTGSAASLKLTLFLVAVG